MIDVKCVPFITRPGLLSLTRRSTWSPRTWRLDSSTSWSGNGSRSGRKTHSSSSSTTSYPQPQQPWDRYTRWDHWLIFWIWNFFWIERLCGAPFQLKKPFKGPIPRRIKVVGRKEREQELLSKRTKSPLYAGGHWFYLWAKKVVFKWTEEIE